MHQETKEQTQKFNEEYNQRLQNKQDSGSSVLYGYMQEINLFFTGGFNNTELTNLNHFLSTNQQLNEVNQKIKNFETSTQQNFQTHIDNFNENFSKSYQRAIESLENLNTTAQNKISILKKNFKITYLFYSISGLLIFLLVFLSVLLMNEYRNYQNKAKALTNIATRLEGKISINAQGQVTLELAKLKTIFKEDKNSIYLIIKE